MKNRLSSILAVSLVLAVLCVLAATASAAVIRVSPDGDDANSGASWALAKKTVQAAIDAASEGDEIWVATGIYPEHIKNKVLNEVIDPVPINVALYGGFAGTETARDQRDWMTNLTVLDGGGGAAPSPPEVGSVVHITGGAGRTTRVDGFVITRGHAIAGGGILIEGSGPTIVNNNLWLNSASIGGGIGVSNYDFVPPTISHSVITDNRIYGNSAVEGGGGIAVVGAARLVSYDPAAPIIARNIISQNSCVKNGGGIGCWGHTAAFIADNFIVGNVAASDEASFAGGGGGIYATSRDLDDQPISYAICAPQIVSNAITANGGFLGAGIYCWDTDDAHGGIPVITNNTITSNNGIGVYWKTSSPVMTNNIVAFNPWGLQQPAEAPTSPTIGHNCVYGNSARGRRTDYNSIADQTGLNGNISIDPLLANVRLGEVRVQPGSPCRNAGSSSAVSTSWKDIQGEDRIQGDGVDIGADESDGTSWDIPTPVIHVRSDGDDAEDGTTWAKAKKTVGAGATAAFMGGGGEVWVAEGTYVERDRAHGLHLSLRRVRRDGDEPRPEGHRRPSDDPRRGRRAQRHHGRQGRIPDGRDRRLHHPERRNIYERHLSLHQAALCGPGRGDRLPAELARDREQYHHPQLRRKPHQQCRISRLWRRALHLHVLRIDPRERVHGERGHQHLRRQRRRHLLQFLHADDPGELLHAQPRPRRRGDLRHDVHAGHHWQHDRGQRHVRPFAGGAILRRDQRRGLHLHERGFPRRRQHDKGEQGLCRGGAFGLDQLGREDRGQPHHRERRRERLSYRRHGRRDLRVRPR